MPKFTKDELFLLYLLKKIKFTFKMQKIELNRNRFNEMIKRLEKDDLILKNHENYNSVYTLTEFGKLFAVCLSKRFSIVPKELESKIIIRWFFEQI